MRLEAGGHRELEPLVGQAGKPIQDWVHPASRGELLPTLRPYARTVHNVMPAHADTRAKEDSKNYA